MAVPRIARIHLVYQFIILTLLIFAISYNEILPDKRFLLLALIPIFCYQLIIVFCCSELLPLPAWFSWTETRDEVLNNQESNSDNTGSLETILNDISTSPKESIKSPAIPRARLSRKNKETSDSVSSSDANTQTIHQNVSGIFKKAPFIPKTNARRSESTKSYVFKHRENNFDNLDANDNFRLYKTRNWRSLKDQNGGKSQTDLKSPNHTVEEKEKTVTSPVTLETLEESIESDLTDLSRSYSFPFRQRKHGRRMELGDNSNDFNIPVMPAWNAIDYFEPSNTKRRRKSISTEAIDRELRLINSHFEQNSKNDFTQSMEVARESIVEPAIVKKGLKSSASFNKWKQGISSYFSKTKKENVNIKVEATKQDDDNKKPFLKDLFSSKEALNQGPEKKAVSIKRSSSFLKSENKIKQRNRSPSYISYEDDFYLD